MKIIIKATNLDLTQPLKDYITSKFESLYKLISKHDLEGAAEARVEVARITKHHQKGKIFYAEMNLHFKGKNLRVTSEGGDIREVIDLARDELWRRLEKYNERSRPQDSRGEKKLRELRGKP